MEKKFLLYSRPAVLCIYPKRWTIQFYQYNPSTKEVERIQRTFKLNRIKDLKLRRIKANDIINHLNDDLIPYGWPFVDVKPPEPASKPKIEAMNLIVALDLSYQRKIRGKEDASVRTFKSQYKVFKCWLDDKNIDIYAHQFSKRHAKRYSEHLKFDRKYGASAYNNHMGFIKGRFTDLIDDEIISKNPFKDIKREVTGESRFQIFKSHERQIVAKRIFDEDIWLFRFILLVYQCYLRKSEIRRLKFSMFDLNKGIIKLDSGVVRKNKLKHIRNIPKSLIKYFNNPDFTNNPTDFFVFGKGMLPHKYHAVGNNTPTARHRRIINQLEIEGLITNGENLHLYGWKFTGITENLITMKLNTVRKQAGHTDPKITLRYERPADVIEEIQDLKVDLFDRNIGFEIV